MDGTSSKSQTTPSSRQYSLETVTKTRLSRQVTCDQCNRVHGKLPARHGTGRTDWYQGNQSYPTRSRNQPPQIPRNRTPHVALQEGPSLQGVSMTSSSYISMILDHGRRRRESSRLSWLDFTMYKICCTSASCRACLVFFPSGR